ncbi:MAG: hypothetical protein M1829_001316 [Trizodia sp. TS-e1964]|nr:MAG: hypothetical protein M1829_001316 [Trizodia sp. TS-e1964]
MESERLIEDFDPADQVADMLWFGPPVQNHTKEQYIMYFITGNPGLISYYSIYLRTLSSLLPRSGASAIHYCGFSLPGFGTTNSEAEI